MNLARSSIRDGYSLIVLIVIRQAVSAERDEIGANLQCRLGGHTTGGLPEAVMDPAKPGTFVIWVDVSAYMPVPDGIAAPFVRCEKSGFANFLLHAE